MRPIPGLNFIKPGERGFTLIELLVSLVIGLIILSAVLGLFVSMILSDSDSIKAAQLNQELRGAMSLITRDMRRAGSNRNAAIDATGTPPSNPFADGTTRLTIAANQQGNANSCIVYAYDENETEDTDADGDDEDDVGFIDTDEVFGYRWDSAMGTVEARAGGAACNAGGWTNLTDENLVEVTNLSFTDTTVVEAGINIRQIAVSLSGRLVKDNDVSRTINETVKLRNDEF